MSQVDVNDLLKEYDVSRRETRGERKLRLVKDFILFTVAIASLIASLGYCFYALLDPSSSAEEKKWAMSVISAVTGGMAGYLLKK